MSEQGTAKQTGRDTRLIIGLAAGVGVVIVALVVWLVMRPATGVVNGKATPEAARVPDVSVQPSGWSVPVALKMADDSGYQVTDTGVGSIVVIESWHDLQAVDLDSLKVLWSLSDGSYWTTLDDGTAVVSDGHNVFFNVDVRTGKMVKLGAIPSGEQVILTDGHEVISATYTGDPGGFRHYCARALGGSGDCQWQAVGGNTDIGLDVFGDGRWISTDGGIYDVTTGGLASFGAAAGVDPSTYFFTGPAGGVVRISSVPNDDGTVSTYLQAWDTDNDVGLGTATLMTGSVVWSSFSAPLLLSYDDQQQVLAAYSWTTAQQLWRLPLRHGDGEPAFQVFGGITQVWTDQPSEPGRPQSLVIDNATGAVLWQGDQFRVIAAGQQVVYMAQCDEAGNYGSSVYAFDTGFNKLWSEAGPTDPVDLYVLAGHVLAVAPSTGQLWVLQTL